MAVTSYLKIYRTLHRNKDPKSVSNSISILKGGGVKLVL
jgi:hypothetical protein